MQAIAQPLAPYQQRVIAERDDLAAKLDGLMAFLRTPAFEAVDEPEQQRLVHQAALMTAYRNVLQERIDAFLPQD